MRFLAAVVVAVGTALTLSGCSPSVEPGTVLMSEGNSFTPSEVTVKAGENLEFRNDSGAAHSVTAYDDGVPEGAEYFSSGGFNDEGAAREGVGAGLLKPDDSFEITFDEPGTYRYFCIPHESQGMKGTITVH
ncbi:MAG: plastocyanin/azurin family copper-binding protein [Actinomycetota bacterium]|nr:plastocyanin/azurin family copper-binding protein [Actinomycetota bacterium]